MISRFKAFLPIFILVALWDAFTTVFGTITILGGSNVGTIMMSIVVVTVMLILFLLTFEIWSFDSRDNEFMLMVLKVLWVLAFSYDLFTSYNGNNEFILSKEESWDSTFILIATTIIVSGSTIIASWIIHEEYSK